MLYNLEARTLLVTLLHLIELQWRMLALCLLSTSTRTVPIWEERSLLLANKASVKTSKRKELFSRFTKRNPLEEFLIYY